MSQPRRFVVKVGSRVLLTQDRKGIDPTRIDALCEEVAALARQGFEPVIVTSGAIACGWADARPEVFGPALSSWAKAMRHRAFWAALVPRPETLSWLATGAARA